MAVLKSTDKTPLQSGPISRPLERAKRGRPNKPFSLEDRSKTCDSPGRITPTLGKIPTPPTSGQLTTRPSGNTSHHSSKPPKVRNTSGISRAFSHRPTTQPTETIHMTTLNNHYTNTSQTYPLKRPAAQVLAEYRSLRRHNGCSRMTYENALNEIVLKHPFLARETTAQRQELQRLRTTWWIRFGAMLRLC